MADTVRFAFGENGRRYSDTPDPGKIGEAVGPLRAFFPGDRVKGARILDIGCDEYVFQRHPAPSESVSDA